MAKLKIEHDSPKCIGCQACTIVAPDYWEINQADGLAHLKGSKAGAGGISEREIDEKEADTILQAVRSCPVSIIRLKNAKGEEMK